MNFSTDRNLPPLSIDERVYLTPELQSHVGRVFKLIPVIA